MKRLSWSGFLLAFIIQAALLGWMVAGRAMLLATGEEVRLAVQPVDPRDFLRGDYVILSYQISNLDRAKLGGDSGFSSGDAIYVTLVKQGDVWVAAQLHKKMPVDGQAPVMRGTVDSVSTPPDCTAPCERYRVEYGLEKFFVPEGEGRSLERLRNDEKLTADIAVGSDGASIIKRLLVNGEARYEAGLF